MRRYILYHKLKTERTNDRHQPIAIVLGDFVTWAKTDCMKTVGDAFYIYYYSYHYYYFFRYLQTNPKFVQS